MLISLLFIIFASKEDLMMKIFRFYQYLLAAILAVAIATPVSAESMWIDVTANFLKNPGFDTQDRSDWVMTGESSAFGAISYSCMEMWNGYMRLEHTETHVPDGHYRISVQALYRTRNHEEAYRRYTNGTEVISAYLFVNDKKQALVSEYAFHFDSNVGRTFTPDDVIFFPNSMETAQMAFAAGAYQNEMEFDVTDGILSFGLYNEEDRARRDNWMIFDTFRLEQLVTTHTPPAGSLCLNEVMVANVDVMISPAYNFDGWIELYNTTDAPVTLGGCYLSDDAANLKKWHLPEAYGNIPAHGYRQIWMGSNGINSLQCPFKLDCEGGTLLLSDQQGRLVMTEDYPEAVSRAVLARTTDGGAEWSWTDTPTPGASNSTAVFVNGRVEPPVVTEQGGFFSNAFTISPTHPQNTTLRYTTDGTTPTMTNGKTLGSQGLQVSTSTTCRFRLYQDGMLPSEVVTRTFIKKDHDHTLPVIMVSADDRFLYDDTIGVYVRGTNGRTGNGQSKPANWNMDWDRPVNFHYVLPQTNEVVVNQDVDFSISGGWTRSGNPKSFKLKADRVYEGRNTIDYPFFAAKPFNRNKSLQIRYGGNDNVCRIKDAALHEIIQRSGIDLDVMSYQPAVHYLNGEYKGLINVREPNNKDFAFANWGFSKDQLEVYEQSPDSGAYMMLGSEGVLQRLYELSQTAGQEASYEEITSLIDIDEYTNYMAAELFLSSWDWPDNNVKAYRKTDGGRYRFTFFDLDAAFGTEGRSYDEENEIFMDGNPLRWIEGMQWHRYDYIYDTGERLYGEIKFCTFFLNMLKNATFRRRFIDALSIMGGSVFEPVRAADILDELGQRVRPTMQWEGASPDASLSEISRKLEGRAQKMAAYMKDYEPLNLSSTATCRLTLDSNVEGAHLFINGQRVPYASFTGVVFAPTTLTVEVPSGYQFIGWGQSRNPGSYLSHYKKYTISDQMEELTLVACFKPIEAETPVVINEVSASNHIYANEYFKRNDWVELYNVSQDTVDVEGMYLSDTTDNLKKYAIAKGNGTASTKIAPGGFLMVWCDNLAPVSQLHAPFKIDADGGVMSLMAADESWTHLLEYGPHGSEETVGRYPDGGETVYKMNIPTIARPNMSSSYMTVVPQDIVNGIRSVASPANLLSLRYAARHLIVRSQSAASVRLGIYNLSGRQLSTAAMVLKAGRAEADCRHLAPGCYVARATDENGNTVTCKFIVY